MNADIVNIGLARNTKHEYYVDGQGPLPSVTTILRAVDKSGPLMGWAKRITAEAAVDHRAELNGWVELAGREGAVSLLTKAATNITEKAATTGSDIHALAEAIARGQEVEVSEDQAPFVAAYRAWVADFQPRFLAAEEMIANLTEGYAGTLDAIVELAGESWLIDLKTSRNCYPETALQLAGYAHAEFIGRPNDPKRYALPHIDQYGVLHVRPEGYQLIPYEITDDTYRVFLAAKRLSGWSLGDARTVMGQPVGPALLKFQAKVPA